MSSSSQSADAPAQAPESASKQVLNADDVAYIGYRTEGPKAKAKVKTMPSEEHLSIDRSRQLQTHSRGFEWGYGGSGPAQLALAILLDYYDDEDLALECYQRFCGRVISRLECPAGGRWTLTGAEIEAAVEEIQADLAEARQQSPSTKEEAV